MVLEAHRSVAGIILAAGAGRRFGGDKRRVIGPSGLPLLHSVLSAFRPAVDTLLVVIPPDDAFGLAACREFDAVALENEQAEEGMGSSLRLAAHELLARPEIAACVIGLADMPLIRTGTVEQVRDRVLQHDQPVLAMAGAVPGFPRALPRRFFEALAQLQGDSGARAIVDWSQALTVAVADNSVLIDIDTPQDLANVCQQAQTRY